MGAERSAHSRLIPLRTGNALHPLPWDGLSGRPTPRDRLLPKPTSSESVDQRDDSDLALVGAQRLPVGW